MKAPLSQRVEIVKALIQEKITPCQAAELLNCTTRTVATYQKLYLTQGEDALRDNRTSNNHRISKSDRQRIVNLKLQDRWRSARNIADKLQLPVHEITVWRILKQANLTRENTDRVKPIQRFEADHPNDLWQTDIMGRIDFPKLGSAYLIAAIDDRSRFCLAGHWFPSQNKINVFLVWYEALSHWGTPKAMLQDEGSQYKARARFGVADYQWYAHELGIKLMWARRAQTKGKIERFWKFVQEDFVKEVWEVESFTLLDKAFQKWLFAYNYKFKSRYFSGDTRASKYQPSPQKVDQVVLRNTLTIHERRKVSRESTISLYGKHYVVPKNFIGRRVWLKIIGNKIVLEANGTICWKTKLS